MAPMLVTETSALESTALESVESLASIELVSRNCKLEDQTPIKLKNVPSFDIPGLFIAYASPDSTYAVTKRLMDGAKKSILIGIYDFTAGYIKTILLNAIQQRGVKVSLMVDLDGVKGELEIFEELKKFGAEAVPAPSCASENINVFRSSHEKVVVIDDEWTLVQSGNYSGNSIPLNEKDGGDTANFVKGNRDMGIAIKSKPLAAFFTKLLRKDMKLELDATALEALMGARAARVEPLEVVEAVPKLLPEKLFPSKQINPQKAVKVTPVLTPDNYMKVVPDFLRAAKKSILIEQQYIKSKDSAIAELLNAIRAAMDANPDLDVRIILGKIFGQQKLEQERKNVENLKKKFGLKLGTNIRYIDTKRFVHCHNKLIIVDNQAVLVSSQNWSNAAVLENREAGLLLRFPQIARYFADIFESDWSTAIKTLPKKPAPEAVGIEALTSGNFVEVNLGDYVEF